MKHPVLFRLIAVCLGVFLFWGTAEVASRIIFSGKISYDVEMWRYSRSVKTVGRTPGLRFEHRPEVKEQLMGVEVRTNSDGLREREIARFKPDKTVRIAVVGDSITFGWGVAEENTYGRKIEQILNTRKPAGGEFKYETLNFGVGNYAIADVANMLEYKALSYSPDLVIYGAFLNDAENTAAALSGPWLLRHSLAAVWFWGRVDRLLRTMGLREDYLSYYLDLYRDAGAGQQRVQDEIRRMARLCSERDIPLVVALLPELHTHKGDPFALVTRVYQQQASEAGAVFIDLQQALPDNGRENLWVSADDAHPNAQAMALYAPLIVKQIPWSRIAQNQADKKNRLKGRK